MPLLLSNSQVPEDPPGYVTEITHHPPYRSAQTREVTTHGRIDTQRYHERLSRQRRYTQSSHVSRIKRVASHTHTHRITRISTRLDPRKTAERTTCRQSHGGRKGRVSVLEFWSSRFTITLLAQVAMAVSSCATPKKRTTHDPRCIRRTSELLARYTLAGRPRRHSHETGTMIRAPCDSPSTAHWHSRHCLVQPAQTWRISPHVFRSANTDRRASLLAQ